MLRITAVLPLALGSVRGSTSCLIDSDCPPCFYCKYTSSSLPTCFMQTWLIIVLVLLGVIAIAYDIYYCYNKAQARKQRERDHQAQ